MKKLFAFVAAALFSVATFASREVVPSDDDLASYATKTFTMCIYNESACNDIVLIGTYAGWNAANELEVFQAVSGFEGWYVVTWDDPDTDPAGEGGIQAKPVQLDGSGNFSWDYQLGPDAELVRGTADLLEANNGTEVDIKNIGEGILVIDVKSWKNNPCTAVYHVYNVALVSPDCNEEDYVVPAISGGFNNWAQQAMEMNELKTAERQQAGLPGAVFEVSFKAAEGSEFKFRSSEEWGKDWSNEIKEYNADDDAWTGYNGGANIVLGEQTDLFFDLGDPEKYLWNNCEKPEPCDETKHKVVFGMKSPEGAPAAGVEVIGTFDGWTGTAMELNSETGWYIAILNDVTECDEFKFREAGTWDNEIVDAATGEGLPNFKFGAVWNDDTYKGEPVKWIELDLSGAAYVWKANWDSVEDVVLTVKAQKVIVDGIMYIVRDNKLFSIEGTQVR